MFKLAAFLALSLLAVAVADSDSAVSAAEIAPVVRGDEEYAPKCHITYKKCCSYKAAVYGKCHKEVCRKEKKCHTAYHVADVAEEAGAGEAIDAAVKEYEYGQKQKQQHYAPKKQHYAPKKQQHYAPKQQYVQKQHYAPKQHYVQKRHYAPAPKQVCVYVNKCLNVATDCVKSYKEEFKCDHEKKKEGDYGSW